ncbi:hypothetical protein [Parasitella parasitica]|uniref:F-box domain-containing protein n=1 Tax=Parasitella parasitica TaxID=35722 RepID=A0A0B7NJH7_9FUNG|nr:hypothetical protein [Parasitella parasitica]
MLTIVPFEVLELIIKLLNTGDIYSLVCSCSYLHLAGLSYLYRHLELGSHIHIRQLQDAVKKNEFLKDTIFKCTKQLTLKSRQNRNNWRLQDLIDILGPASQVESLIFRDFNELSTVTISETVMLLPNLTEIEYRYCHIDSVPFIKNNKAASSPKLDCISYIWTDFTEEAITPLLFSQITHLELGPNRSKYDSVNRLMVSSITQFCPSITHLTIELPEIDESVICTIIAHYSIQLLQLSIKCDSHRTLVTLCTHATRLKSLSLRITKTDEEISLHMAQLVTACGNLSSFQIASTQLDLDVPDLIWTSIITCYSEDHSVAARNKRSRAQHALMTRRKKQEERNDPKSELASLQRLPLRRNNFWFYTVSEEALEQRYHYNNSFGQRYQHQRNDFECISLGYRALAYVVSLYHSVQEPL